MSQERRTCDDCGTDFVAPVQSPFERCTDCYFDWPAPKEVAHTVAENAGESRGVTIDMLADANASAASAAALLSEMAVEIDNICDDGGLYPNDVIVQLRHQQRQLQEAAEWMNALTARTAEVYDDARDGR